MKQLFLTEKRLQDSRFQGRKSGIFLGTCQVKHPHQEANALLESFRSFSVTWAFAAVMLFASSLPFLMDSLLFQLFHFLCFCSVWWVQGWYFSCHSTLIFFLHGWHWRRLLKGSKLSDILKVTCSFPVLTKLKGSLPSSRTAPSQPPVKVAATSLSSLSLTLLLFTGRSTKSHLVSTSLSPLSFSNYCLRKPETVTPIP